MPRQLTWKSPEGLSVLESVVRTRIPQWERLRDFQQEWIPLVLDGQNLVAFTATGDGKSALFVVPVLVHLEVSNHPALYPNISVRDQVVVMVITPTKALATSIVRLLYLYHYFLLTCLSHRYRRQRLLDSTRCHIATK